MARPNTINPSPISGLCSHYAILLNCLCISSASCQFCNMVLLLEASESLGTLITYTMATANSRLNFCQTPIRSECPKQCAYKLSSPLCLYTRSVACLKHKCSSTRRQPSHTILATKRILCCNYASAHCLEHFGTFPRRAASPILRPRRRAILKKFHACMPDHRTHALQLRTPSAADTWSERNMSAHGFQALPRAAHSLQVTEPMIRYLAGYAALLCSTNDKSSSRDRVALRRPGRYPAPRSHACHPNCKQA